MEKSFIRSRNLLLYLFLLFIISQSLHSQVKTGIDVLIDENFKSIENKKIALIVNQTAVNKDLISTVKLINDSHKAEIICLFSPEHGVYGIEEAGEEVGNSKDLNFGIPVISLYGKTKYPPDSVMKKIDALVFDIQDIGCRSYTYINTLGDCMEAALKHNKEFIVLDRPNPLGGLRIEGNNLDLKFRSFVGYYEIPYVYGMTIGELALYINSEIFKNRGNIKVVKLLNWKREMLFASTGLTWIPTSPHVPENDSPLYYVATGVLGELAIFNNGIGYTKPFKILGADWIDGLKLKTKLDSYKLKNIRFYQIYYKPFYGKWKDKLLDGIQLDITNSDEVNLMEIQFYILKALFEINPDIFISKMNSTSFSMFNKVVGTKVIYDYLTDKNFEDIFSFIGKTDQSFIEKRSKYLLY